MNPVLRSSAAHLFVASLDAPEPDDGDAHHLFRVLRVRDGESVTVSDGAGRWRPTVVRAGSLEVAGDVVAEPAPVRCEVAAAIPKGDRLEWMVQKLTEVGATRIVLVHFARSVVRWDAARATRQMERLQRVVREAASQSRRVWLPLVEGPVPAAEVLAEAGAVLLEPAGADGLRAHLVVVGPEGGCTAEEVAAAQRTAGLGQTILRVETAALVAASRVVVDAPLSAASSAQRVK